MEHDNWKHRRDNKKCGTCMWSVKKEVEARGDAPCPPEYNWLGRCRKHAPTMNGFPPIFMSDWCGEHKLDENKI